MKFYFIYPKVGSIDELLQTTTNLKTLINFLQGNLS